MQPAIQLLIRNLASRDTLLPTDVERLESLRLREENYPRGATFIAEGSRPEWSCLVREGLCARAVNRPNGTRQLTALHVPGDFVDLHGFTLKCMDHSVVALSACTVVFVRHAELLTITETCPHLTRMLWLSTTVDAAIQRRMTALLGRHTPLERLGHLLCEIYTRMHTVGLAAQGKFWFPITQAELADLLGLSVVHMNRTVQDLRATNMVRWEQSEVTLVDFPRLRRTSNFDPVYLNLWTEPR
jgi:CRP-like cAMP-binding protein